MRGTALNRLVVMLRGELGHSLQAGVAAQSDDRFKVLLSNKQILLASSYDWAFLKRTWDATLPANVATLSAPVSVANGSINFDRKVIIETLFGQQWLPLEKGIGRNELNALISPSDPVMRWDYMGEDVDGDILSFWPTPFTDQTLKFTAQRRLRPLVADLDVTDLDDLLLVYMVAADLASEGESKAAPFKIKQADERLRMITQGDMTYDEPLIMGRNLRETGKKQVKVITIAP